MSPSLVLHPDAGRHLNDDDLVSILDGASSTVAAWSDHFTACVACHTRVTTLSSAANALRVAYQETHITEHLAELPPRLRWREH
jgi:5-methylcytosine-specific restriction endonuclease McrA